MDDLRSPSSTEELGYFYDTIHGRVALEDFPDEFHPALKSSLRSQSLDRLKRVSQLGHTSLSFFSATHTRFSHAVGTMLVMNKLFHHVRRRKGIISAEVFDEVTNSYPATVKRFGTVENMVHCHLLLAALYQDVGELPFQKVTSLFFMPLESEIEHLVKTFERARPREWSAKKVFSVLSLKHDLADHSVKAGFDGYNQDFLVYLLTGDGAPTGARTLKTLLQLVDGVIDADRLDYVYRDAAATIGSLSRPDAVLESIVLYGSDHVVVSDPRPVTDFLSTRMRLWTFVYSSVEVRFRQVLLKTVLDGLRDDAHNESVFEECGLHPKLPHDYFMQLDDNSLIDRIKKLPLTRLKTYRRCARELLMSGTLDYECRVLKRGNGMVDQPPKESQIPDELFFDLLLDHGNHQLYRRDTIFVRQALTSKLAPMPLIRLEESSGALAPLFSGTNSAVLVPNGYYIFLPKDKRTANWETVDDAISQGELYGQVVWEDAKRSLGCPSDTRATSKVGRTIGISYCAQDYPTVVRVVRELHRCERRYQIFMRPFDGIGDTSVGNSEQLMISAEAVLVLVSVEYVQRALDGKTCIGAEVRTMHDRAKQIPIVPIGVDERHKLNAVKNWDWGNMNEAWRNEEAVIPNDWPLRTATEEKFRECIGEVLKRIDQWHS